MKVSVFTSSFNHGKYLPQAIESVLGQTYQDFEYLLFDDGSTDNTWDVIQEYAEKDNRIRAFRLPKQKNVGVVINRSIQEAVGDVWSWCPADDSWLPELLEKKVVFQKQHPDSVIYHDWFIMDEKGVVNRSYSVKPMTPDQFSQIVWSKSPIGFTGIFIPTKIFEVAGPFPEHLGFSEDFYWMIKATIHKVPFRHLPEKLHRKRKHPNSLTKKNLQKILGNIPKIRADLMKYKKKLETGGNKCV